MEIYVTIHALNIMEKDFIKLMEKGKKFVKHVQMVMDFLNREMTNVMNLAQLGVKLIIIILGKMNVMRMNVKIILNINILILIQIYVINLVWT